MIENNPVYDADGNCTYADGTSRKKSPPRSRKRDEYGAGFRFEVSDEFFGNEEYAKSWILKGAIAFGETSAWVGPPGSLKSALMADLSVSVAYGLDWHGKKFKGHFDYGVIYFALERADLVRRRIEAQIKRLGLDPKRNIVVVPATIDLLAPQNVAKVANTIKNAEAFTDTFLSVVIFDTHAKLIAAGGGDEDKAKDQGRLFTNLERLKELTGRPHIALVGHTGKDESRGARGSNAFYGDVDLMVEISGGEIKTATITKANDLAEGPLFSFKSEIHQFGSDEDGDPITVNIVSGEEVSAQVAVKREPKLSANQKTMLGLLRDAGAAGLSTEDWNAAARDLDIGKKRKATLHDIARSLKARNLAREYAGIWHAVQS
ncbi:AAA family ATPase [Bradyrhizobium sp. USDA 4454]